MPVAAGQGRAAPGAVPASERAVVLAPAAVVVASALVTASAPERAAAEERAAVWVAVREV